MKNLILPLLLFFVVCENVALSQKTECNWFYELKDNGFEEAVRRVSSVGESTYSPYLEIFAWPTDPNYKGFYGMQLSWPLGSPPQLIGGDQDKIQMSIKVNGVNKKYSFSSKYSKGYTLAVVGGATKDFLNDLKTGSELNIVINLGQAGIQSQVYKYGLNCSSSCITKLMAP